MWVVKSVIIAEEMERTVNEWEREGEKEREERVVCVGGDARDVQICTGWVAFRPAGHQELDIPHMTLKWKPWQRQRGIPQLSPLPSSLFLSLSTPLFLHTPDLVFSSIRPSSASSCRYRWCALSSISFITIFKLAFF